MENGVYYPKFTFIQVQQSFGVTMQFNVNPNYV